MSHLDFTLVKKHPVATGAVVIVGALLVYAAVSGGGGGGGTVVSSNGVDPAVVNAQTQLALANLQAGVQTQGIQGQITMQMNDIAGQLAIRRLDLEGATLGYSANLDAMRAQLEESRYEATVNRDINLAGIGANRDVQLATLSASMAQIASNNAVTTHLADVQAATSIAQAQLFTGLQTVIAQGQTTLGVTQSNNQVNIAAIQAHTAEYIAHQNANASQTNGLFGMLGNFASLALAFL